MYRLIKLFLVLSISLLAYSDMDMDGVDDRVDKCPNTPLTELVDLSGCTIKKLVSPHHFDISLGAKYIENKDVKIDTTSIQLDYYYKDLSFNLYSSYFSRDMYNKKDSGVDNTYLNGYYKFKATNRLSFKIGGGVSFPTYDSSNNRLDYTLSSYINYYYNSFSILGGVGYTVIGDKNTDSTIYKNSTFYNIGVGYYFNNILYSTLTYNSVSSIYTNSDNIKNISLYNYYKIDKHWFLNLSYTHGLNSISMNRSVGARVGYYW